MDLSQLDRFDRAFGTRANCCPPPLLYFSRDFFQPQPNSKCALLQPDECQSDTNVPNEFCNVGDSWRPPLPDFIDESDIVCTDDKWKTTEGMKCAKVSSSLSPYSFMQHFELLRTSIHRFRFIFVARTTTLLQFPSANTCKNK